jgi:arylsulfatase A-like enzyme
MIAQGLRGGSTRPAASGVLNGQGQGAAGAVRDVPPQVQGGAGVFTQDMPEVSSSAGEGLCVDCDVLLLTVCSLRRDHVGAYGALDIRTPHLDRVAAEGMRFDTAYSASNFTLASLTAVLTGRFGSSTGVTGWDKGLTTDVPTLPEVLGHYGYQTGGFTTDAPSGFRPDYGLDRGFQRMEITPPPAGTPDGRGVGIGKAQPGQVVAPAARWLSNQSKDKPVFMMVHSRTAHFPFVVDKTGFDEDETGVTKLLFEAGKVDTLAREDNQAMPGMAGGTEQEGIVKINGPDPLQVRVNALGEPAVAMWKLRYLEAVQRMDHDMGALWTALEARDRLDKTVIVVVADHGESLNDYGELLHGDAFHDGVIHVPLMIRVPGLRGGQSTDALVSQVDILPTILDLVGAVDPSGIDGQSMVPLLTQAQAQIRSALLSEGGVALQEGPEMPGAVIAPPWVMLRQRRGCGPGSIRLGGELPLCLFNTVDDPPQVKNIAVANRETVELLLERWNGFREARANSGQQLDLSPAFVEELQRTGYDFRTGAPE